MAKRIGVTGISAMVDTIDDQDVFPTSEPKRQLGGWAEVADITERNAITTNRRRIGMKRYVISEGITYKLEGGITNSDWKVCAIDFELVTTFSQISNSTNIRMVIVLLDETNNNTTTLYIYNGQSLVPITGMTVTPPTGNTTFPYTLPFILN